MMNKNDRFSRGGRRNFKQNERPFVSKYSKDVQPEQLTEKDVGITEYMSDLKGFSGVLKSRFSDFHVNEINSSGEIAKFTSTEIPPGLQAVAEAIPTESPSEHIPQETWDEIATVLQDAGKIVELEVTGADKVTRGAIHNTVKKYYERKVCCSTIEREGKKYIEIKKFTKDVSCDQRTRWNYEEYVYFLVYKENIDTLEATLKISDCLNMKSSSFTYAGVKDRRAKTTQWFSVRRVEPWKLFKKTRMLRNVHVGNVTFKDKPLKLGELIGNRFRIALRNVIADDDLINDSMKILEEKGFINYYGLQRFGNTKEVPTYDIGLNLLLGKFKEACELILKCKQSDNPASDITKAKKIYEETKDGKEACAEFSENENTCVEHKLLAGLAKVNKNDYVTALESVPRNMRLLYIHSFQGLLWNKMVSRRIQEFGLKSVIGDLVYGEEVENLEESVNEDVTGKKEETGDEIKSDSGETLAAPRKKREIKVVTEGDLENYSIYDVILPLPGYDIVYPENKMKEYYQELLTSYGLSLETFKQNIKTYALSGAYRKVLRKVTDLSWKIVKYNSPYDTLIRSDFEEFLGKAEPKDNPDGAYKALIIDFCLKSSSYATMVIREVLKTDTSTNAHSKLNAYHQTEQKKQPTSSDGGDSSRNVSTDGLGPNSLLTDPAKYEEFKKSIFGDAAQDLKRKPDEESQDVPIKKTKTDE